MLSFNKIFLITSHNSQKEKSQKKNAYKLVKFKIKFSFNFVLLKKYSAQIPGERVEIRLQVNSLADRIELRALSNRLDELASNEQLSNTLEPNTEEEPEPNS